MYHRHAAKLQKERSDGKPDGLWIGYSKFECPEFVVRYSGQVPAHVLLHLYRRASGRSYNAVTETDLTLAVRLDKLAKKIGLHSDSVSRALARLEKDGKVSRRRQRRASGKFLATRITPLDATGQPLETHPQQYGICRANDLKPFITVPKDCLAAIDSMELASHKATYLSALILASREKNESVWIGRPEWQMLSGLSKHAFNRGVRYCKNQKLLTYTGKELTVCDPLTGKPTQRWRPESRRARVDHDNPHWSVIDLDDLTARQWQNIFERLLKRKFDVGDDGWTRRSACPYCSDEKGLHLNFTTSGFKCHSDGCGASGRLLRLVKHLTGMNSVASKQYIKAQIEESERVTV